ncbi:MAG: ATP-binding protein, partial [Pseudomonadota bacterium]
MPQRNVMGPLGSLKILVLLSIGVPLLLYTGLGVFRYLESKNTAEQRVSRSLRVAHEHATKVLSGAEAIQDRVFDLVNGQDEARLRGNEQILHRTLRAKIKDQRQIQSVWIIGANGQPIASSHVYPVPILEQSERADLRSHREGTGGRFLSEPTTTQTSPDRVVNIGIRFDNAQGEFGGVVNVSLLTDYFQQFHSDLVADEPGLAVNMFRENGPIYTRWPTLANAPERLGDSSPVLQRVLAGERFGHLRGTSSVDGQDRLLAFRKVGDYPLFIGTGMNLSSMRMGVFKEMAILLAFGLPPCAALFVAARVALRRTREAVASAQQLEKETLTRRRAEEALLQAQKLEAMGRLTGGVAHDFNNALMVISNNAFLLKRHVAEAGLKPLQSIGRAVDSATKLTRQLLAFSRRQPLLPEHVVLQDKLPLARELITPVLGSQITLHIEVAPETRAITVDLAELELALLNLSINARDAMPSGGRFLITAANALEGTPAGLKGDAVAIHVSDTGSGIDPAILDKVFEPFFTTKPVGHGTGLGLSQVYGLCERAGGAATVASTPGQGTQVRLFFPAAATGAETTTVTHKAINRQLGKRVLVVEDNHEVAGALLPLLEA